MKIVPASIEEQINRVDRQRSLWIGISAAVLAAWSIFRLISLLYIAATFGVFFGALVFQFVLWGVIGAVAGVAAVGFLVRCNRGS
jgi:amino acid permease